MTGRILTVGEGLGVLRAASIGSFAHTGTLEIGTGGAEGNVAIGLARLGVDVIWLGRVGDDGLGRRVVRELRAEGVDVRDIIDPDAPTGLLLKENPAAGRTVVSYYRAGSAGSRLTPADLGTVDLSTLALVHVTGITPALSPTAAATIDALVDEAVLRGIPVSFDINHRSRLWSAAAARPAYASIARRASIVFAGEDEARLLVPHAPPNTVSLAAAVSELGAREVVIKRGEAGALAWTPQGHWSEDAISVDVVDTVGAGDAFVAGYLSVLIEGGGVSERLARGVRAGAAACTHPGDWEGLPTLSELEAVAASDPVVR